MKKRKHSIRADLSFQAILILMFIAILFLSYDHAHLAVNGIILCASICLFMVTYFTSVKIGFILDIIFVFLLMASVVLDSLNNGSNIQTNVFFWLLWPMGMIVAISTYVREHRLLDKENDELTRRVEKFSTIDELTQMNNLLGFERDASVYMNISRRYELELELVLWRLSYQEDMERLLGAEDMKIAIGKISDSFKKSLRKEDLVYLVDKDPYIWGTLLFAKSESAEIVIKHVKDGVASTSLADLTKQTIFALEVTGVVVTYDKSSMAPLTFLNQAKRKLWRKDYGYSDTDLEKKSAEKIADTIADTTGKSEIIYKQVKEISVKKIDVEIDHTERKKRGVSASGSRKTESERLEKKDRR